MKLIGRSNFLFFYSNRNQLQSLVYQSYLQVTAPTEKYMFDKSNFKIQSVRKSKSNQIIDSFTFF
jgi:hypothetical protein